MKPSMLGLLIAAGAFAASAIYLGAQVKEERRRADQYLEESRALAVRVAELEKARADLETLRLAGAALEPAAPEAPLRAPPPGPHLSQSMPAVESAPVEVSSGPRRTGPPERSEAFQNMMRAQIRGNNKRLYADIGLKLGLSPEEANKLIDLITDQQVGTMDRMRQERASATQPTDRGALMEKIQQENLAQVSALIGADKMGLYQQYQDSLPARQEVEMLSRQLEGNDAGLSKVQRDRMVEALADERSRLPAPKFSESVSREEYNQALAAWQADYNQRASTRASSILTGDQLKAYNEYQKWTQEMRQQFDQRRGGRDTAGGPPGAMPAVPAR